MGDGTEPGGWWMGVVPPHGYDLRYETPGGAFLFVVRYMPDGSKQVLDESGSVTVRGSTEPVACACSALGYSGAAVIVRTMLARNESPNGGGPRSRSTEGGLPWLRYLSTLSDPDRPDTRQMSFSLESSGSSGTMAA